MCGLYGYFLSSRRTPELRPDLGRARDALRHRGPDGEGTYTAELGPIAIGLAHTRLAVVDTSAAGGQPMATDDGSIRVVLNGEIYNFVELRAQLEARGARFRSTSDTEVLLHGYRAWGLDMLPKLRGMYAFAIWDERDRSLLLVRDRLGVKPLYFAETPDGLVFASEVRALLAAGGIERRLSLDAVRGYLRFGAVQEPCTLVESVKALPPGQFLRIRAGRTDRAAYWQLPLDVDVDVTPRDAVDRFQEVLRDAVRIRLRADVPMGVFLSGGVDSAAVLAVASELGARLTAFTVDFDGLAAGELPAAAETAARYGCPHVRVTLEPAHVAHDVEAAVAALDQPSSDGPNTYFVSAAARRHGLVVALSGIGGDEVFAGYPQFGAFRHALRLRRQLGVHGRGLRLLASPFESERFPRYVRKAAALADAELEGDLYSTFRATLFASQVERLVPHPRGTGDCSLTPGAVADALAWGRLDAVNAYSAFELSHYVRNTLLRDADAMSMAHALEVREPLLDQRLVELAMRVPGPLKLARGDLNKPLLWSAVGSLPRAVATRPKAGFSLPFPRWLRGPLRPIVEERLSPERVRDLPWLAGDEVRRLKDSYYAERGTSWVGLWSLVALADWCHRHGVAA